MVGCETNLSAHLFLMRAELILYSDLFRTDEHCIGRLQKNHCITLYFAHAFNAYATATQAQVTAHLMRDALLKPKQLLGMRSTRSKQVDTS